MNPRAAKQANTQIEALQETAPQAFERIQELKTALAEVNQAVRRVVIHKEVPNYNDRFIASLKQGELIFYSFQSAYDFAAKGHTNYEKKHGLKVLGVEIVKDAKDIKLGLRSVSDGSKTLILFFKNSLVFDIWKFWVPSDNQFKFISAELVPYIDALELSNVRNRVKK